MTYLVGTDEAGYGPNLGPLVISVTAWSLSDAVGTSDLYDVLKDVVSHEPKADGRTALADSKALYSTARGLGTLERGLLAVLALNDCRPATWRELWRALCPEAIEAFDTEPWHVGYDEPVPVMHDMHESNHQAERLRAGVVAAGVGLVAVRSRAVFPQEWNRLCREYGNKATALSHLTLTLLAELLQRLDDSAVSVVCDKHGGRNRYRELLQAHFPESVVEVHGEAADESRYEWGPAERRVRASFRAGGERHLPTAVASMASKYLRELSMRAFNAFWRQQVPNLRPTAGYAVDARRFMTETVAARAALGIDDGILWRLR